MSAHEGRPRASPACDATRVSLSAFVDHELGAGEAARVERHLRRCAACRHLATHERALVIAVRRAGTRASETERAPASLRARVARLLDEATDASRAARD